MSSETAQEKPSETNEWHRVLELAIDVPDNPKLSKFSPDALLNAAMYQRVCDKLDELIKLFNHVVDEDGCLVHREVKI